MKNIQWFPGHMTKAMRDMEKKRDLCDGVICVLDARAPIATVNKNLNKIFGSKPILYVLNKADLADGKADAFVKFFEERGRYAVKCDSTNIFNQAHACYKAECNHRRKARSRTGKRLEPYLSVYGCGDSQHRQKHDRQFIERSKTCKNGG